MMVPGNCWSGSSQPCSGIRQASWQTLCRHPVRIVFFQCPGGASGEVRAYAAVPGRSPCQKCHGFAPHIAVELRFIITAGYCQI
jgi:hypothetical protein